MLELLTSISALLGFSARGQCSNGQGWDNAQAEGECIIHPKLLLHCPSPLTPVMHKNWYINYFVLLA